MSALSDHLPALSAEAARSLWLPEGATARSHEATSSMAVSYNGEAFLEASTATVLVHIGPGAAERAINYIKGHPGSRALLFHPSPYIRAEQQSWFAELPNVTVIHDLSELDTLAGELVNVYLDESCFDLNLLEAIAARTPIDWLIGAYESLRYTTPRIYQRLKSLARNFRLRVASLHTLIHAGPADTVDVSLILPLEAAETFLASAGGPPTISAELIVLATDLGSGARSQVEASATPNLDIVVAEAPTMAEALTRALACARGRYLGFAGAEAPLPLSLAEQLFAAAMIGNTDLAITGAEPGREQLVLGVQRSTAEHLTTAPLVGQPALFRRSFLEFHNLEPAGGISEPAITTLLAEMLLLNPDIVQVSLKGTNSPTVMTTSDISAMVAALLRRTQQLGTRTADILSWRMILTALTAARPPTEDASREAFDNEAAAILQTTPPQVLDTAQLLRELPENLRPYAEALLTEPAT